MQAFPFQELSCDLLLVQPEVASAHIYGRPRQPQRGIDLKASLGGGGLWLVQCKAYKSFNATQLTAAAEEFRQHLSHWQQSRARRFTIFVGCGVEDTKVWDAVDTQREQFNREGITFELWDSRILKDRLQPHRAIVERHCRAPWWVDQICGTASPTGVVAQAGLSGESSNHGFVAAISTEIGQLRSRELEEIRELIRTAREQSAEERLHALRASLSWAHLPAELRSRALRTGVGLVLNRRGDLAEARALLAEAKEIEPHRRMSVAEALLISREAGAAAALDQFSHPSDPDEWNFRLALLLSTGRTEEALRIISAPPFSPNAETFRLQALAHLSERDVSAASTAAQRALALQPRWQLVRETAAVVDYFRAISPASEIWVHLDWPIPPEWHLVRRDAESAVALQEAEKQFAALAGEPEQTADAQRRYQAWQLACLGCDTSRQGEAGAQARALLAKYPGHIAAVAWTLARGWDIPLRASRGELEKQCRLRPRIDLIQALFALLAHGSTPPAFIRCSPASSHRQTSPPISPSEPA
jgi:hypothetical protein